MQTVDEESFTVVQGALMPGSPIPETVDLSFEGTMEFEKVESPVHVSVRLPVRVELKLDFKNVGGS